MSSPSEGAAAGDRPGSSSDERPPGAAAAVDPAHPADPMLQPGYSVCFGWGWDDLGPLAPSLDAVVIVDVLRFTTCVSVACARDAVVFPYAWASERLEEFARSRQAEVASRRRDDPRSRWSLSPTDLSQIPAGTRLVLPSPNGSTLSLGAAESGIPHVFAGCLRNAAAMGHELDRRVWAGGRVAVIAAGERWASSDGTRHRGGLRPALEDVLGAGAVLSRLGDSLGTRAGFSPEARAAAAVFDEAADDLMARLLGCGSGRELLEVGYSDDVATAAVVDADDVVPYLANGAYRPVPPEDRYTRT